MLLLGIAGGAGPDGAGCILCCMTCPGLPMIGWLIYVALKHDSMAAASLAFLFPAFTAAFVAYMAAHTHPNLEDPEQVSELADAWDSIWYHASVALVAGLCVGCVPIRRIRARHNRIPVVGCTDVVERLPATVATDSQLGEPDRVSSVSAAPWPITAWLLALCILLLMLSAMIAIMRR